MSNDTIKVEARRLVDSLPDDASWDDLLRLIAAVRAVAPGSRDQPPCTTTTATRPLGLGQGQGRVTPAFFEPLPEDWLAACEGEVG